ncbi:SH3 domain-containing protein [Clostridium ihumii]|uniref:SH3 domain-containing protein n=1 Tax=Clostridium ihumii TaxID=1470356 RepID=UPI0005580801|nr:SH3 domain-containing protein [Clostridium ihumii]
MAGYFNNTFPKIREEMLNSNFWIENLNIDLNEIASLSEILEFNKKNIEYGYIRDIFNTKNYDKYYVDKIIKSISKKHEEKRYVNGRQIEEDYFENLEGDLNLSNIKNISQYGMCIRRTIIKSYPTEDRIFKNCDDYSLDRFMESAINVCEPCTVLHESLDGKWMFIETYNCMGWVKKEYVALGKKDEIEDYCNSKDFIIVTGKRITTGYNPLEKRVSLISIDMGVKMKLLRNKETIYDMDTTTGYVALFPIKSELDQSLEFKEIVIPRSEDVSVGFLPYNSQNIIKQAFKCLGERYGWGGEFFARDCSSFVLDVLKTMGVYIPRNTGEQENRSFGEALSLENREFEDKKKILDSALPSSILYMNGHVMIYLGKYENEYYIIHDTVGFYISRICDKKEGDLKYIKANGVTISPMSITYTTDGENYIRKIKTIKIFK